MWALVKSHGLELKWTLPYFPKRTKAQPHPPFSLSFLSCVPRDYLTFCTNRRKIRNTSLYLTEQLLCLVTYMALWKPSTGLKSRKSPWRLEAAKSGSGLSFIYLHVLYFEDFHLHRPPNNLDLEPWKHLLLSYLLVTLMSTRGSLKEPVRELMNWEKIPGKSPTSCFIPETLPGISKGRIIPFPYLF